MLRMRWSRWRCWVVRCRTRRGGRFGCMPRLGRGWRIGSRGGIRGCCLLLRLRLCRLLGMRCRVLLGGIWFMVR